MFENLSFKFLPGDKVAVIGPNGIGKTTLLKILMEEVKPDSGTVEWGVTVERSYFPQDTTDRIKGNETLYQWLQGFDKDAELAEIRNCLGRMLFSGEEQQKSHHVTRLGRLRSRSAMRSSSRARLWETSAL